MEIASNPAKPGVVSEATFRFIAHSRDAFRALLETCSHEALNTIPEGFSNNVIWNFGHVVAAQQSLCYRLSGLPYPTTQDEALVAKYTRDTKPDGTVSEDDVQELIAWSHTTLAKLRDDHNAGIFKTYQSRTSPQGYVVNNIEDAVNFVSVHDAMHFGIARTMARLLERRAAHPAL